VRYSGIALVQLPSVWNNLRSITRTVKVFDDDCHLQSVTVDVSEAVILQRDENVHLIIINTVVMSLRYLCC